MVLEIRHRSAQKKTADGVKEEIIREFHLPLEEKQGVKIVVTTSVVPDSS